MRIYHSYRPTPFVITAGAALLASIILQGCSPAKTTTTDTPTPVSLTGTSECLPHKDKTGPQTMECAFGLKTDDGSHYALDLSATQMDTVSDLQTDVRVKVQGTLVPIAMISSDVWQKYDVKGIVQVLSVEKLQ